MTVQIGRYAKVQTPYTTIQMRFPDAMGADDKHTRENQ
jgi:hypothetical protein